MSETAEHVAKGRGVAAASPAATELSRDLEVERPRQAAPNSADVLLFGHGRSRLQAAHVLRMQQVQGNRAVSRLIQTAVQRNEQNQDGLEEEPRPVDPAPTAEIPTPPPGVPPGTPPPPAPNGGPPGALVQRSAGDAILGRIASFARNIPGYALLTVALGRDPISGATVERNAPNLIRGVLSLVPGGAAMFDNLQQSGAIDRAFAWFNAEINQLGLTYDNIRATFRRALDSLSGWDILNPIGAIQRVVGVFTPMLAALRTFAAAAGRKVLEFIFEGVLTMAGPLGQQVLGIVHRGGDVFSAIIRNPVGFVGNLVRAVGQGFRQFAGNIATHLQTGLMGWLFGTLGRSGLQLPQQFDLRGIVSLVLQILGLTYSRLRTILVRLIGERPVAALERTFEFLRTLVTQGIGAAWRKILEFAEGLVEGVISAIRDWVVQSVVGAAITRLISMFNPAGAVIQAIIAIYNTVQFFIERGQQIAAVANSVFESVGRIAAGDVGQAASSVEQTMARTLPVVLGFLARLIGLGNVSEHIRSVIQRVQGVVERALTRVGSWIATRARSLLGWLGGRGTPPGAAGAQNLQERLDRALGAAQRAVNRFAGRPVLASVLRPLLGAIRLRYGLRSLDVVPAGATWSVSGTINPTGTLPTAAQLRNNAYRYQGTFEKHAPGMREVILSATGTMQELLTLVRQRDWRTIAQQTGLPGPGSQAIRHQLRPEVPGASQPARRDRNMAMATLVIQGRANGRSVRATVPISVDPSRVTIYLSGRNPQDVGRMTTAAADVLVRLFPASSSPPPPVEVITTEQNQLRRLINRMSRQGATAARPAGQRLYTETHDLHSEQAVWQDVRANDDRIAERIENIDMDTIDSIELVIFSERFMCRHCRAASRFQAINPEMTETFRVLNEHRLRRQAQHARLPVVVASGFPFDQGGAGSSQERQRRTSPISVYQSATREQTPVGQLRAGVRGLGSTVLYDSRGRPIDTID
jgi:hypothetical protein